MNKLYDRRYQMLTQVIGFAATYDEFFASGTLARDLVDQIRVYAGKLNDFAVSQSGGFRTSRAATAEKTGIRQELLAELRQIAKTARVIAKTTKGFDVSFKLPKSEGEPALLQAAKGFAASVVPIQEVFVRHGMRATFVDELNGKIRIIEREAGNQSEARAAHKTATSGIDSMMKKCNQALLDLDVIMSNLLRDHDPQRKVWESARHVKRPRRKHRQTAEMQESQSTPNHPSNGAAAQT